MFVKAMVGFVGVMLVLLGTGSGQVSRANAHPLAYPTRCVHVVLPPEGRPLPEVCVVYPL